MCLLRYQAGLRPERDRDPCFEPLARLWTVAAAEHMVRRRCCGALSVAREVGVRTGAPRASDMQPGRLRSVDPALWSAWSGGRRAALCAVALPTWLPCSSLVWPQQGGGRSARESARSHAHDALSSHTVKWCLRAWLACPCKPRGAGSPPHQEIGLRLLRTRVAARRGTMCRRAPGHPVSARGSLCPRQGSGASLLGPRNGIADTPAARAGASAARPSPSRCPRSTPCSGPRRPSLCRSTA